MLEPYQQPEDLKLMFLGNLRTTTDLVMSLVASDQVDAQTTVEFTESVNILMVALSDGTMAEAAEALRRFALNKLANAKI